MLQFDLLLKASIKNNTHHWIFQPITNPASIIIPPTRTATTITQKRVKDDHECTQSTKATRMTEESSPRSSKKDDFIEYQPRNEKSEMRGEKKLKIKFEDFGKLGKHPQCFGKNQYIIPDGLCGSHKSYEEWWKFSIHYMDSVPSNREIYQLKWKIQNLSSGTIYEEIETEKEALSRNSRTIANRVFIKALNIRALEYTEMLKTETNETRRANLKSLIQVLTKDRFTEGPLAFGLQHYCVQVKARALMKQNNSFESTDEEEQGAFDD